MVDKLGPGVGAREDFFESQYAYCVNDTHCELGELGLGDNLLERVLTSEGSEEVVAVHDAMNHAIDQTAEGLR